MSVDNVVGRSYDWIISYDPALADECKKYDHPAYGKPNIIDYFEYEQMPQHLRTRLDNIAAYEEAHKRSQPRPGGATQTHSTHVHSGQTASTQVRCSRASAQQQRINRQRCAQSAARVHRKRRILPRLLLSGGGLLAVGALLFAGPVGLFAASGIAIVASIAGIGLRAKAAIARGNIAGQMFKGLIR